jgi:beta-lactamase regulating signal transducer with metallopeptidase domain
VDVVLNWIWQGALVALATAAVLRVLAPSRPQARYAVAWVACLVVLALPCVPLAWAVAVPPPAAPDSAALAPLVPLPVTWWTSTTLALALWTAWVAFHGVRLAIALVGMRIARRQCRVFPPDVEARLRHWARVRGEGRRTRLVLSPHVPAAAVLGGGAPLVALAPFLLEPLDDDDLDRVVIHEWAHVQRRDDVAQWAELVVWAIAGWHPALWWIGRQLHLEREAACDATAVAVTGSATRYAGCLATLAALRAAPARPFPALAVASPAGLRQRIVRVLALREVPFVVSWRRASVGATVLLAALALGVGGVEIVGTVSLATPTPQAPPARQGGDGDLRVATLFSGRARPATEPLDTPVPGVARSERHAGAPPVTARTPHVPTGPIAMGGDAQAGPANRLAQALAPALSALPARAVAWPPHGLPRVIEQSPTASPWPPSVSEDPTTAAGRPPAPPWTAAAEAGEAMGRGSERAARATAGFFNRLGSKIASSF